MQRTRERMRPAKVWLAVGLAAHVVGCSAAGGRSKADDDDGGGAAAGSGGDGGGGGEPACAGFPLMTSGALDVDLAAVDVSGQVTVGGAALPPTGRGSIELVAIEGGARHLLSLAGSGPFTYAVTLPPGVYDVVYVSDGCPASGVMPCGGGTIMRDVALEASGSLDIDIPVVSIQGAVTVNGATMPAATSGRGSLAFASLELPIGTASGAAVSEGFASSGPATYAVRLVPGRYQVLYQGNNALCVSDAAAVPCNGGVVMAEVALTTSGSLDVDVPTVTVRGDVTVNGAPMPNESSERGALVIAHAGDDSGAGLVTKGFGSDGPASYAVSLVAGTYDVTFVGNSALCLGPPSLVPCNAAKVATGVDLTASGSLDVDVPAVTVHGDVTVNGAPMASEESSRGALNFAPVGALEGQGVRTRELGTSGRAQYSLRLVKGRYVVMFEGNGSLCITGVPEVPCNAGVVVNDANLAASGALDVDLPAVTVQGAVTVNGAAMPTESFDRGALSFARGAHVWLTPSFATSAPATYAARLLAGSYTVGFAGNPGLCAEGATQVPCNSAALLERDLVTSGSLDVDVPAIRVSGNVTLRGGPLLDGAGDRGALFFASPAREAEVLTAPFAAAGPALYEVTLVPGSFVVGHRGNPGLCDGATAPGIPCADQVLLGCDE